MILKYPPPASFLNFTSAKSGSIPVVSQSMTRPIVPVGAMTVVCALRYPYRSPSSSARVPRLPGGPMQLLGAVPLGRCPCGAIVSASYSDGAAL